MVTSIRLHNPAQNPQFAGKNKNLKKAGFIALMLGSAGRAYALPANNSSLALNTTQNNTSTDTFHYQTLLNQPISKELQAKIESLSADNEDFTLIESKPHRKMLRGAVSKDNNPVNEEPELYGPDDAQDIKARQLLKKPPFAPMDINRFSSITFPNASPMQSAPITEETEEELRASLQQTLTKRFKGNAQKAQKAVKLFDDPALKTKVPDPKLRAAIVNLVKTAGLGAIDVYKGDTFGKVEFKNLTGSQYENASGVSILLPGETKRHVWINEESRGEDLDLISSILLHEALHSDTPGGAAEELINQSFDTLIYAKQVAENPDLAKSGTKLARRRNVPLALRLNTRDEKGNLRLFGQPGDNVLPGSAERFSSIAALGGLESLNDVNETNSTPGNPLLASVLKYVTGEEIENPNFDRATLDLLDKKQKYLKPEDIIKVAKEGLGLDVGETPSSPPATKPSQKDKTLAPKATAAPTKAPSAAPASSKPAEAVTMEEPAQTNAATTSNIPKRLLLALGLGAGALGLA